MEYQKMISLLDNTSNEPSRFRTKNLVEINEDLRGTYNISSQIRFETSILKSDLCDYSDAYALVSGILAITAAGANDATKRTDQRDKGMIFKNCAPFLNT